MPMYCGIGGVQKEIKNLYTGVGGVRKDITEMWAGNAGVKKQIFSSVKLLGDIPVGSEVTLTESGSPELYIVVNQGLPSSNYDSSCDGTWLLRKFIFESMAWNSGSWNTGYNTSSINKYLNSTFVERFSTYAINNLFMSPKIPIYSRGQTRDYSAQVFLLSTYELDLTSNIFNPAEGAAMQYFYGAEANKRIAYFDGAPAIWWSRSMHTKDTDLSWYVSTTGNLSSQRSTGYAGIRPALILKKDTIVSGDGSIVEG